MQTQGTDWYLSTLGRILCINFQRQKTSKTSIFPIIFTLKPKFVQGLHRYFLTLQSDILLTLTISSGGHCHRLLRSFSCRCGASLWVSWSRRLLLRVCLFLCLLVFSWSCSRWWRRFWNCLVSRAAVCCGIAGTRTTYTTSYSCCITTTTTSGATWVTARTVSANISSSTALTLPGLLTTALNASTNSWLAGWICCDRWWLAAWSQWWWWLGCEEDLLFASVRFMMMNNDFWVTVLA